MIVVAPAALWVGLVLCAGPAASRRGEAPAVDPPAQAIPQPAPAPRSPSALPPASAAAPPPAAPPVPRDVSPPPPAAPPVPRDVSPPPSEPAAPHPVPPVAPVAPPSPPVAPASAAPASVDEPPPSTAGPPPQAGAASFVLRGLVLEKGTRTPLAGAVVVIDAGEAVETDTAGRFRVTVPAGRRHVRIQDAGHEAFEALVEVSAGPGEGAEQVFRVAPRLTGERYETVVAAPSPEVSHVEIAGDETTKTAGSFGDPVRVLESLPGVTQVVWPLAIYAIRGANPGNTGFFIDGLRVPAVFHFALGPSVIHPFFLEGVDFFPGGAPARYGDSLAGAVALRTTSTPTDRAHASADVRLFDAGALVTAPWDGGAGTVALAGRYSYTGMLFSLLSPDQTLGYADYQARVAHRLGPGRLTLFVFGSRDALGHKDRSADDVSMSFQRADLRWDGGAAGGRLTAALAAGADSTHSTLVDVAFDVSELDAGPRLTWTRGLGGAVDLELGAQADARRYRPKPLTHVSDLGDVARDRTVETGGAWVALGLRAGSRLILVPALRAEAFREGGTQSSALEPRLSARLRVADALWLKGGAGRYLQMPSLPLGVAGLDGFGLRDYGLQRSWQGSGGVEATPARGLGVDATAFYQRYWNLTELSSESGRDVRDKSFFVTRDGESYGVELMLRRAAAERLHGWLSYTLSWSRRDFDGVIGASEWDQRHNLNLVAGYRLPRGWSVGGRVHLNTGRPVPVSVGNAPPEYRRLPAFWQVDLRADRRFVFDRFLLDAYVEIVNTTFNREVVGYVVDAPGVPARADAYRIALPSVGVHGEF